MQFTAALYITGLALAGLGGFLIGLDVLPLAGAVLVAVGSYAVARAH